jgi:hypothetical protein
MRADGGAAVARMLTARLHVADDPGYFAAMDVMVNDSRCLESTMRRCSMCSAANDSNGVERDATS